MKEWKNLLGNSVDSKIVSIRLFKKCPCSCIYLAKDEKNREYIIKKYKTRDSDIKQEFENQKKAYEIFQNYSNNVAVPTPITFSKKHNILAMEYIKGITLTEYLRNNNLYLKGRKLKKIYYLIGGALQHLHKNAVWKTKEFIDGKMHLTINRVKLQPIYKEYLKLIKKNNEKSQFQRIHGNFKTENILISNSKIYFIDFAYDYKGSIYYDLAKLIESSFTAGFRNIYFPAYNFLNLNNFKRALIKGYFKEERVNAKIFNYYQVLFKIYDLSCCKSRKISFIFLKNIYNFRIKKLIRKSYTLAKMEIE